MMDPAPTPELLRSLGRLVRGLSALFWALPATLVVCFYTAHDDGLEPFGVLPPLLCTGWLIYGLWQLAGFQQQERVWRRALDRAAILGLVNAGLSPFLYWSNRLPEHPFFVMMLIVLGLTAVLFLSSLNHVLRRLGAMLPDEALRLEIGQFTGVNLSLLRTLLVTVLGFLSLAQIHGTGRFIGWVLALADRNPSWYLIPLVPFMLLPLALTMAMLWKTKEVILESIFGGRH